MNARNYRVSINLSPLDFPAINGLGSQADFIQTEPPVIVKNNVILKITRAIILIESYTNIEYEVLKAQSVYEIPVNDIKTREDIYEFYKDTTLSLNDAYQYVQKQISQLPNLSSTTQSIETYEREIDGVFHLLSSRN